MARSSWKPLYIHRDFIEQQNLIKEGTNIIVFNRSTAITKALIGAHIQVYNGIRFFHLIIDSDMVGHKIGEFAPTCKKPVIKSKKKDKKK
jgi:small subunit ribosomal protein S19